MVLNVALITNDTSDFAYSICIHFCNENSTHSCIHYSTHFQTPMGTSVTDTLTIIPEVTHEGDGEISLDR